MVGVALTELVPDPEPVPDPDPVSVPVTVLDTVASAEGVLLAVLEGVAVKVVVLVRDQAVPETVCVGVREAVLDRVGVRLGVCVIVSEVVWVAVDVELTVTVPVRLAVRLPDAVTVGVPVL